ncbi:MAG: hypothetical protein RL065_2184 [Bacteroidota bacterium]|jgi:hypothetical protein
MNLFLKNTAIYRVVLVSILIILFCLLNPSISSFACGKRKHKKEEVPAWIKDKIKQLEAEKPHQFKSYIAQFDYHGKKVFYIPADCCDQLNPLYDESGSILCYPSGGFNGKGDGRCSDFILDPKTKKVIWEDVRQKKEVND